MTPGRFCNVIFISLIPTPLNRSVKLNSVYSNATHDIKRTAVPLLSSMLFETVGQMMMDAAHIVHQISVLVVCHCVNEASHDYDLVILYLYISKTFYNMPYNGQDKDAPYCMQ